MMSEDMPTRMKRFQRCVSQPCVAGFISDRSAVSAFYLVLKEPVCSAEKRTRHVSAL